MKKILLFLIVLNSYSQELHHQVISSLGSSIKTVGGIYVSQTIGQSGAMTSYSNSNFYIQQGFQQSIKNSSWKVARDINESENVITKMFPNPVDTNINFEFSKDFSGIFNVLIFDMSGRIVFSCIKDVFNKSMTLDISRVLSSGDYIIQISSNKYNYNYTNRFLKL